MPRHHLVLCTLTLLLLQRCTDPISPRIEAILPASGSAGEIVHVVGEGYGDGELQVFFGGHGARVLQRQARRVLVEVPAGLSGLIPVVLMLDGRVTAPFDFWANDESRGDGGA